MNAHLGHCIIVPLNARERVLLLCVWLELKEIRSSARASVFAACACACTCACACARALARAHA
eukprot:1445384-Alexandrium_andersonii.AAC.1